MLAFTLAETLIVIGIIGVVAALTLPNLNSSTGNKERVVKVKKIYSDLNNAYGSARAVYGPMQTWIASISNNSDKMKVIGQRFIQFLKISKDCGLNGSGCFSSSSMKFFDGTTTGTPSTRGYNVILADGTSLSFIDVYIIADIDGPNKGPNSIGEDVFVFEYSDNGVEPCTMDSLGYGIFSTPCSEGPESHNAGEDVYFQSCATYWVITYENMDYLKCSDKLSSTNVTCK